MGRAGHSRLRARDHGDSPRPYGVGDEILAIGARAPKGPEDVAGRDLAVVDRKAGDLRPRLSADQFAKPHLSIALLLLLHLLGERMPVGVLPPIGEIGRASWRARVGHNV